MRYVRNSPVFHANQISTPVLIVQGDMDVVPMSQGEEMFTALYRLRRPARFIRYWDDGHVIERPAHVRHLWAEVERWLATYIGAARPVVH